MSTNIFKDADSSPGKPILPLTGILLLAGLFLFPGKSLVSAADNNERKSHTMYREIEFTSQGAVLRGRFYLPEKGSEKYPVVVMAHGFTTTINGMTADKYAERFREAGFAALLYDHRNLGISDGEPRQRINFWVQCRGYMDAIGCAITQPETDRRRIVVWGTSLSAREAFVVGAIDDRVAAVINQIPAYGHDLPERESDDTLYNRIREIIQSERIMDLPHTVTASMPVVAPHSFGTPPALKELTAYRWFMAYGGRLGTHWKNEVSFSKTELPGEFQIGQCIPHLKAPVLMVVAGDDEMEGASPVVSRAVYDMILQPKEWVDITGGHFGLLYYPGPVFDKSSAAQIRFLKKYLLPE